MDVSPVITRFNGRTCTISIIISISLYKTSVNGNPSSSSTFRCTSITYTGTVKITADGCDVATVDSNGSSQTSLERKEVTMRIGIAISPTDTCCTGAALGIDGAAMNGDRIVLVSSTSPSNACTTIALGFHIAAPDDDFAIASFQAATDTCTKIATFSIHIAIVDGHNFMDVVVFSLADASTIIFAYGFDVAAIYGDALDATMVVAPADASVSVRTCPGVDDTAFDDKMPSRFVFHATNAWAATRVGVNLAQPSLLRIHSKGIVLLNVDAILDVERGTVHKDEVHVADHLQAFLVADIFVNHIPPVAKFGATVGVATLQFGEVGTCLDLRCHYSVH